MRIAVIGTAGRSGQLTKAWYQQAYEALEKRLLGLENITLVSGGAAWSDHLAVTYHLVHGCQLELHFPAKLSAEGFHGNRDAGIANYYHERFSKAMGSTANHSLMTLHGLDCVKLVNMGGFKARNLDVARQLDLMYAFGAEPQLGDGGTAHTWRSATCEKHYIQVAL